MKALILRLFLPRSVLRTAGRVWWRLRTSPYPLTHGVVTHHNAQFKGHPIRFLGGLRPPLFLGFRDRFPITKDVFSPSTTIS